MSLNSKLHAKIAARRAKEARIEKLCAIGRGIALTVAIAPIAIGAICLFWATAHYWTYIRPLAGV